MSERRSASLAAAMLAATLLSVAGPLATGALAAVTLRLDPGSTSARPGDCAALTLSVADDDPTVVLEPQTIRLRVEGGDGEIPALEFCEPEGGTLAELSTALPGLITGSVTTDAQGRVTFGVRSNADTTLDVRAFVDGNGNGELDPGETETLSTVAFETAACSDGDDNDGDGRTDFPGDRGCRSADDGSETRTLHPRSRHRMYYGPRARAFKGRVTSRHPACVRGRRIVLKKARRGPDRVVARSKSRAKGGWRIARRDPRGRFYATAKRKVVRARDGDRVVCRAARTGIVRRGR